jgi:putative heme-binding domain-containing protein
MRRFLLPWAEPTTKPVELDRERRIPELAGGDWLNGRRVFFGEQAGCAKCHRVRGEGGALGPDLSNLIHRDYASVRRDIREPSAAINPDHVGFEVELEDGESLSGVLVADAADALTLGDSTGKTVVVSRNKVRSVRPATLSIMPEGLEQALGESGLKDLLTFLLMPPPLEPGPIEIPGVPPPRKRADVERLLGYSAAAGPGDSSGAVSREPLSVVLCAGPKDHGPGEHDYPLWQGRWSKLLALDAGVEVGIAEVWPSSEQLARAGVLLFFNNNPGWNEERGRELDAFLARGGGAVYFHWAVEGREAAGDFARRIGLASDSRQTRYRHGPIDLEFHPHPIANGFTREHFTRLNFVDETYWNLVGDPKGITLVASAVEDGAARPQMWTREVGRGRVVVCLPGHYNWTFDDPVFRVLALRGLCWAARQPLDRLGELATVGARVVE